MDSPLETNLTFFGRFFSCYVFVLNRNWFFFDFENNKNWIQPISGFLLMESENRKLTITWYSLGIELKLEKNDQVLLIENFPGEVHEFNISSEQNQFLLSSSEHEIESFDLLKGSTVLQGRKSEAKIFFEEFDGKNQNYIKYNSKLTNEDFCILYLHGGPFQRFTNEYSQLINCLKSIADVVVPTYCGDPVIDNDYIETRPDSETQVKILLKIISSLKAKYKKIVCVSHSYGCYLGRVLHGRNSVDALVTINGVFDIVTLKELSSSTFKNSEQLAIDTETNHSWFHIHSENDPVVPLYFMYKSLERTPVKPTSCVVIQDSEHEVTTQFQVSFIHDSLSKISTAFGPITTP